MRVAFMGSPEFAVPCLRALHGAHDVALVVSQPDKPAGRGGAIASPAVAVTAKELGLPVIQPKSARTGELERALRESGAEVAVVVAYGKILPRAVLDAAPRGCVNVHGSLLPKYRGAAPVQWAVIDGEKETGVCIMQLDEGMDTGPVLLEKRVPIYAYETSGELLARLAPIGADALLDVLARDAWHPVAQDHARATHARMLTKADGAIDFSPPAPEVLARIRGVDPWPGAQATLRGHTVKMFHWRPSGAPPMEADFGAHGPRGAPGTVVAIAHDYAEIACGDRAVRIHEIQLPGKKRTAVGDLQRGRQLAVGDVLTKPELG
jgi:methionyl-tRNA formyltransferase